jgi:hypothetical protein
VAFSSPGEIDVIGALISPGETAGVTGWALAGGLSTAAEKAGAGGSFLAAGLCAQAGAVMKSPKIVNAQIPRNMGTPPIKFLLLNIPHQKEISVGTSILASVFKGCMV